MSLFDKNMIGILLYAVNTHLFITPRLGAIDRHDYCVTTIKALQGN